MALRTLDTLWRSTGSEAVDIASTRLLDHQVVLLGSRLEVHASDLEGKAREYSKPRK